MVDNLKTSDKFAALEDFINAGIHAANEKASSNVAKVSNTSVPPIWIYTKLDTQLCPILAGLIKSVC